MKLASAKRETATTTDNVGMPFNFANHQSCQTDNRSKKNWTPQKKKSTRIVQSLFYLASSLASCRILAALGIHVLVQLNSTRVCAPSNLPVSADHESARRNSGAHTHTAQAHTQNHTHTLKLFLKAASLLFPFATIFHPLRLKVSHEDLRPRGIGPCWSRRERRISR